MEPGRGPALDEVPGQMGYWNSRPGCESAQGGSTAARARPSSERLSHQPSGGRDSGRGPPGTFPLADVYGLMRVQRDNGCSLTSKWRDRQGKECTPGTRTALSYHPYPRGKASLGSRSPSPPGSPSAAPPGRLRPQLASEGLSLPGAPGTEKKVHRGLLAPPWPASPLTSAWSLDTEQKGVEPAGRRQAGGPDSMASGGPQIRIAR